MKASLFVALCTHNPRPEYLRETLAALRAQTLPVDSWELLIVDNASTTPLADTLDLSWHPHARIVREDKLGTAHARYRALLEALVSNAKTILFVDDDNVLQPDYFQQGLEIEREWPRLGAWGGQLIARYESAPPKWIRNYLNYLAITPLNSDRWTNVVTSYDVVPPSAGCFLRASVWQRYLNLVARDPRRLTLGACGDVQVRGEDTDLVLTAIDLGLGVGRFKNLQLEHLIPASRLTPTYVAGLVEGATFGTDLLEYIRFHRLPRRSAQSMLETALLNWRAWRLPEPMRSFRRAELRGRASARRLVLDWQQNVHPVPHHSA
jgi:glycosyltransferase involved in cell wall biosynthesis